ncbi:Zinc finger protein [Fasciola hepatica]|uniref:Zinc finger protein n=1 Tax=Fasciola hepatica TaxID=6192 RepID=A0A4E0RWQ9_FASHE|nr:Zinc finger protein [Fasciola hepatica]
MLQPGDPVWVRYSGTVSFGQLMHCMPELNMYTVRSDNYGSTRLVTRGIEDILPISSAVSSKSPPDDSEWKQNSLCGTELLAFGEHQQLLSCYRDCDVPLTSLASPLYIDATERSYSRVSTDEGPSGGPPPSYPGLLSTSPVSFTLSPVAATHPTIHTDLGIASQLEELPGTCHIVSDIDEHGDTTAHSVPTGIGCGRVPLNHIATVTATSSLDSSHSRLDDDWILRAAVPHRHHPSAPNFGTASTVHTTSTASSSSTLSSPQPHIHSLPRCRQSPDSFASDVPSEVELGAAESIPPQPNTSHAANLLSYAIRGISQWADSLAANRQTTPATEPIHHVAICTLNEAVELLLSLGSNRLQTDYHQSPVCTPVTTAATSSAMDALTAALVSPVSEFDSPPSSLATDEVLESASHCMPVPVNPSDRFRSLLGYTRLPPTSDDGGWTSLVPTSLPSMPPSTRIHRQQQLPRTAPAGTPPITLLERRYLGLSEPLHFPGLERNNQIFEWHRPDQIQPTCDQSVDSSQRMSSPVSLSTSVPPSHSSSNSIAFPSVHDSGPSVSTVSPPSTASTHEPGIHGKFFPPDSSSHSIVAPMSQSQPPACTAAQVDTSSLTAGVSVALALRALSQLCQHEIHDPLCASLTELLQTLSSILLVLSDKQQNRAESSRSNSAPGTSSSPVVATTVTEPFDRIPITHLSLGDQSDRTLAESGTDSTDMRPLPAEFPRTSVCNPVGSTSNDRSTESKSGLWPQSKLLALSPKSTRVPFVISPRSVITDKSLVTNTHRMENARSNPAARHAVSKRNRTSSASSLVLSNSSVTSSSSRGIFSQPNSTVTSTTPGKIHSCLLLENSQASFGHSDQLFKASGGVGGGGSLVQKRCGSLEIDVDTANASVCSGGGGGGGGSSTTTPSSGRSDVKKCRKMYGIENRDQWCNQCRWKKACRRFPDPAGARSSPGGVGASGGNSELSNSPIGSVFEAKAIRSGGLATTTSASLKTMTTAGRPDQMEVPVHPGVTTTTTNNNNNPITPVSKIPVRTTGLVAATASVPGVTASSSGTATFLLFPKASVDPSVTHNSDGFFSRSAPATFSAPTNTASSVDISDNTRPDSGVTTLSGSESGRPE